MSRKEPAEEILTGDELTGGLAEAMGTISDEIECTASELEVAPPTEATVVEPE